jgi:tetratricopeptide (TPR) repeat protein
VGDETPELSLRTRTALIAAGRRADAVNGYAVAARYYAAAEGLIPLDDSERSQVTFSRALASFRADDGDAAESLASAFESTVAAEDWRLAAEAAQLLADWEREHSDDLDNAEHWWHKAERYAEQSGHHRVLGRVAEGRANRLWAERRYGEAVALAEQAMGRARRNGDWEGFGLLMARCGLGEVWSGRASGIDRITEAATVLAKHGSRYVAWTYSDLVYALVIIGDLGAANRACDEALASAACFDEARVVGEVAAKHAFLAYHSGDWHIAREIVSRYADTSDRWVWYDWCIWVHGLIAIADGDEDAADIQSGAMKEFYAHAGSALDALVSHARGRYSDADVAADMALQSADDVNGFQKSAMFAAAELIAVPSQHKKLASLANGLPEGNRWKRAVNTIAAGRYADAAMLFDGMGSRSLAARAHVLAASQATQDGHTSEAAWHADQAATFYREVGASLYAEQVLALQQPSV